MRAAVAQLTKAGQLTKPPVSVRRTLVKVGQTTRMTFWTRDLITHKKEETETEPMAENNPEAGTEPTAEKTPEAAPEPPTEPPAVKAVPKPPRK